MPYPVFAALMAPDETAAMPASLKVAQGLAERLQGPLAIVVGAMEIKTPVLFAKAAVGGLVAAENKRCRGNAEAVCAMVAKHPKAAAGPISCEAVSGDLPELRRHVALKARLHGFAVTQTGSGDFMQPAIVETLLFETGRPVLVVPHDFQGELGFDTVLAAWDGSLTAARAVWNALPLLQGAERVVIASVTGEKDLGQAAPASTITAMLSTAGCKAEATSLALNEASVAATLLKHANSISASFVVLGAYGHARWREFVFGGVTRDMLAASKLPLLMAN